MRKAYILWHNQNKNKKVITYFCSKLPGKTSNAEQLLFLQDHLTFINTCTRNFEDYQFEDLSCIKTL